MKRSILLLCLAAAVKAQEFPIADRALRAAAGAQTSPAVAASGGDFFAVWADARARVYDATQPSPRQEWDVYGSRLWPGGNVDTAGGVAISPTMSRDNSPAVIWNGREYVVISASTAWPLQMPTGVMFTRVGDSGPGAGAFVPLTPEVVAPYGATLAAAWNGSEYLVVIGYQWPYGDRHVVYGFIADENFHVLTSPFEISDRTSSNILPSVASDGTSFLVTWLTVRSDGFTEIRAATISGSGDVRRTAESVFAFPPYREASERWPARAVWSGQRYLVTWSDNDGIRARFVDRNGAAAGNVFTVAHSDGIAVFAPAIAWNGSLFLISFSYRNEWPDAIHWPVTNLYAARVHLDGTLVDQPYPMEIALDAGEQTLSAVAASGDRFVIVWTGSDGTHSIVIDVAAGIVGSKSLLSRSIARQSNGTGAFDGKDFGFLWTEESDVMFGRMSVDGRNLDGGGRKTGTGAARALLWNGSVFLAVWSPAAAVRITPDGDVLDQEPLHLPADGDVFSSDGHDFLVLTHQLSYGPYQIPRSHLATYVVTSEGTATDPIPLEASEFSQIPSGVAWDGSHYLVVYTQYFGDVCYKCFPKSESRAILVDRQGRAAGAPFAMPLVGPVAGGDGRFLIVGEQWSQSEWWSLKYTIVNDNGTVVPATRLDPLTIPAGRTDVAWTGRTFVIANGRSFYRLSATGGLLDRDDEAIRGDLLEEKFVQARGSAPLLVRLIDKFAPDAHFGGIERYFLYWTHPARMRSVVHR